VETTVESSVDKLRLRAKGLPRGLRELSTSLRLLGELRERGWQRSVRERRAVDGRGQPQPWMNYGTISMLDGFIEPDTRIFEYGSGLSTVWLARRSRQVHAVEHDQFWFDSYLTHAGRSGAKVRHVPSTGDKFYAPGDDPYVNAPASAGEQAFDLIIIDGWARCSCLLRAPDLLAPDGMIVLDDADWNAFDVPKKIVSEELGFAEIVVTGPRPTTGHFTTTGVYLRSRR
jgi:predicted O-methyltransferase YrrM